MSVIKCKMCGGDLELIEGSSVAVCEYCGSQQTVPAADNEKKLTLFARANRLRLACEFDKAAGVYESIVADFPTEAEAYWGLVLCRYGIEYVDDPATGKKIPTCHRSSFDSVMEDSDFEQALENADAVARRVYRDEAKAIEELRRGIVEVSGKEPPYDIFICYKETAEDGQRTVDSVIAQDMYDALTEKGYRVFFSRISLEDKLGTEYEPYIFAALHSAKIMLAFGTDYEYYNAVWVKNEWSRFLQLMTKDKSKHLIPCYKGIDAYDMPKEFAKLQAQDMGKVGAMQDLLRGVDKIMGKGAGAAPAADTTASPAPTVNPTVSSLLERAEMFLADGDWDNADTYCEKVLDMEPKNGTAYLYKLMAELKVKKQADLENCSDPFDTSALCEKVLQYGAEEDIAFLQECNNAIRYRNATQMLEQAKTAEEYQEAAELFAKISGYKDADNWAQKAEVQWKKAEAEYKELCHPLELKRSAIAPYQNMLAVDLTHTVGLKADGTVVAAGNNREGQCNVDAWHDIAAIATGSDHTVGLKKNGTVVAVGDNSQCNVSDWWGILAIAIGSWHTVGLKSNGTVMAVGSNRYGQCNVSDWKDIAAITAGDCHTVGLKSDGTVVAVGENEAGQCNITDCQDIVAVTAYSHTVGLKANGTVVAVGYNKAGQCNVDGWCNIVAIAVESDRTIGLRADGTVVAAGDNSFGKCNVKDWRDIVMIATGSNHTVGLKKNGMVVAIGDNDYGQCDVTGWRDIVAIAAKSDCTIGLKANGKVIATGDNRQGQCNVINWKLFYTEEELTAIRKEKEAAEALRKAKVYVQALQLAKYDTSQAQIDAAKKFSEIPGWRDADEKAELCRQAAERLARQEKERAEQEHRQQQWRIAGRCQHCGGEFKGLFTKKCVQCHREKDY